MDYGQYVTTMGERPMGLSAYQRNCLGWLRISTLEDVAGYYQLLPLHNNVLGTTSDKEAQAFLLRNPLNPRGVFMFLRIGKLVHGFPRVRYGNVGLSC